MNCFESVVELVLMLQQDLILGQGAIVQAPPLRAECSSNGSWPVERGPEPLSKRSLRSLIRSCSVRFPFVLG